MIYTAIAIAVVAFVLQMQASAWHRGLLRNALVVAGPFATGEERRKAYNFLQPRHVRFRSGMAGLLGLAASVASALAGQWWWGVAVWGGILFGANLLSRVFLPNPDFHYWTTESLHHSESLLRTALMSHQTEVAMDIASAVASLRHDLNEGTMSALEVVEDTFGKIMADTGVDPDVLEVKRQ